MTEYEAEMDRLGYVKVYLSQKTPEGTRAYTYRQREKCVKLWDGTWMDRMWIKEGEPLIDKPTPSDPPLPF